MLSTPRKARVQWVMNPIYGQAGRAGLPWNYAFTSLHIFREADVKMCRGDVTRLLGLATGRSGTPPQAWQHHVLQGEKRQETG